jgi:putative addiction module component (TIGR02574 family)
MAEPAIDLNALKQLPVDQRLQLVEELWDSIAADSPDHAFPLTPEQMADLQARQADAEAHPEAGVAWEVVRQAIVDRSLRPRP